MSIPPEAMEWFKADQTVPLPYPATSMAGKTVIITGSNVGLGLEAARHFVRCKASKVIMAMRSVARGEAAKFDIESSTGITGVAEVWKLDLSSYESVKSFAQRAQSLERIDAVIENASVAMDTYGEAEGAEISITVNVYSTFLLAVLLMPKLKESARKFGIQPVLNIVSSGAGFTKAMEERKTKHILPVIEKAGVDDLSMRRYPLTKLLQSLILFHMSTVFPLENTGVILNVLGPGLCITKLERNLSKEAAAEIHKLRELCGRSAEDGARTLFHAAIAGPQSHGQYLFNCDGRPDKVPAWVKDEDDGVKVAEKLWREIEAKFNAIQPGCVEKAIKA